MRDSDKESTADRRKGQSHPHMTIISDVCYLHVIAKDNIDVIPIYLLSQPVRADPAQKCVHKPCSAQSKNQRVIAVFTHVVLHHFFVQCQGDSLKNIITVSEMKLWLTL